MKKTTTNCTKWANFLSKSLFYETVTLSCSSHLQRWSIEYSKAAIWKPSLFPLQTRAKRNDYQSRWLFIHIPKSSNLSLYPCVRTFCNANRNEEVMAESIHLTQTWSRNVIRDDIQGMEGGNDHISLLLDASKQTI